METRVISISLVFAMVLGAPALARAANLAYDTAANSTYDSGWSNGSNGGFGFNGWSHNTTSGDGGQNGFFVGTSAFGRSWGLYANSGQTASSVRPFTGTALSLNQTFSISMDNGNIQTGGTVGLGLQTSGGTNRLEFFFVGGGSDYRYLRNGVTGGSEPTGISFMTGNAGLRIFVTPLNSTDARLRVTNDTGSSELFNQILTLANATDIARVRVFNANAGSGGANDAFFDDVATPEPGSLSLGLLGSIALLRRRRGNAS